MKLSRPMVIIFCVTVLAIHWLNQWQGTYGLMFDETQYWFWGKHPAWGYYSKPPVIAWLMGFSTALFGDGNFGVKMLSPLMLLLSGLVLYATARRLEYSKQTGYWVLITYLTLPYVTGNSVFFTTDVPLQLCWSVALYGAVSALRTANPRYWLLVGVAAGLGLLSKYTMVAFAASSAVALLLTPANRKQLCSIWPWLGGAVAGLLLAPNMVWNAHHHFVTLNHTNQNVFSKQVEIYPVDMLNFIAAQFVVFGPILLVALLLSLRTLRRADSGTRLLHCFVWPLALAGVVVGLLAGAQAHWISPVYLAGTLIVVPWLEARKPLLLQVSLVLHLLLIALFYVAPTLVPQLHLKHDPFARAFVWNELARQMEPLIDQYPDAVLMTNERKIAAAFTYQLRDVRGYEKPVFKWNPDGIVRDHYDLVTADEDFRGKPLLLVMRYGGDFLAKPSPKAKLLRDILLDGYEFKIFYIPAKQRR